MVQNLSSVLQKIDSTTRAKIERCIGESRSSQHLIDQHGEERGERKAEARRDKYTNTHARTHRHTHTHMQCYAVQCNVNMHCICCCCPDMAPALYRLPLGCFVRQGLLLPSAVQDEYQLLLRQARKEEHLDMLVRQTSDEEYEVLRRLVVRGIARWRKVPPPETESFYERSVNEARWGLHACVCWAPK